MQYDSTNDTLEHIRQVQNLLVKVMIDLNIRSYKHDRSKLEFPEKEIFDEYTPKLKATTYGSNEYKSYLKEMSVALRHHYQNNNHHPEYYANGIRGMSLSDLQEMLCDWKAATLRHHDGDILKSIELNQERFGYSDELKQILINSIYLLEK